MTPEQIEAERVVFEAWAKIEADRIGYAFKAWQFIRTDNGDYSSGWTAALWNGWQSRAELAHAERREMQETEQRLRAEIARLQAIADRAMPDGWKLVPVEPTEAMLNAGARAYQQKERDMYSPTPTEEPGIGPEGYCYLAMLSAAVKPQDGTP